MRAMARSSLLLAALLVLPAGPALAWADHGHRLIGSLAAQALPPEVPAFLRTPEAAADIGELAREPDRSKGAGKLHDSARDPAHFLDVDDHGLVLGGPALEALPPTRADYEAALRHVGTDSYRAGYLPYAIADGWQQLAKDFATWRAEVAGERLEADPARRAWITADRLRRERQIVIDLGVWAHYVGDGSQPLHLSVHFNGWGEGPNPQHFTTAKVHAPFEGPFVRANVGEDDARARMSPFQACGCPIEARTARYLQRTYAQVIPFYALEKAGGLADGDARGKAFAAERIAAGASELRDLVVEAWRASAYGTVGYPPTQVREVEAGRSPAYELLHGVN